MNNFIPKSFDELIGSKFILLEWKKTIELIEKGNIVFISGFSGVGKTLGTKLLIEECGYNSLFLDTNVSGDGKDVLDRIEKFHNWIDLNDALQSTDNKSKKVIVVDEIESFIKIDRNILNSVLSYTKKYKNTHIPVILISHVDVLKKLGDMKNFITNHIKINRLEDMDIFLFFKTRIPKNKIKLAELLNIIEGSNGNIYSAMLSIINKLQNTKNSSVINYIGDEQKTLQELFECKNPSIVEKLLTDDEWMNPLKVHENIIKILNRDVYVDFLEKYLYYELWNSKSEGSFLTDTLPVIFLTYIILEAVRHQNTDGKIDAMDFSKLLSYISTKKKYKKLMYEKVPPSYPVKDLGLFWIHSHIYNKKCVKNIL